MKIILKSDVETLGKAGEVVSVRNGYARNYLIPQDLAVEATTKNVRVLDHNKRLIADKIRKEKHEFEGLARRINEASVTITVQVGEEGKLFGSVTNNDIAAALAKEGIEVDKRKIQLEDPIKEIGSFTVSIPLHHDVTAHLKVHVVQA